ncbi:MAG: hypothetical protein H6872_05905 [Methylobacteriaceae bacterium]|nr:hypothetical protein [Methylobacteriaceae bacterium]
MSVFLIEPGTEPKRLDIAPTLANIRNALGCEDLERIPGLTEYEGEAADMYGDENAGFDRLPTNLRAIELRDGGLAKSGHRPSPNPVQGAVVILTGADRLS